MAEEAILTDDTVTMNAVLSTISANEVRLPTVPIDAFVQEAYDLHEWIVENQEPLINAGLDDSLINDLPNRAKMLRQAQSVWMKERYSKEEAQREWDDRAVNAYELKDSLEASFKFAFRKHPDLVAKVDVIAAGTGHTDMVQDLNDLSVLGKANENMLGAISMDLTELNQAAQWANELATLLAKVNGERNDDNHAKLQRDKAYTHLKAAMDEIRVTGKYVYRKEPEKVRVFQRTRT